MASDSLLATVVNVAPTVTLSGPSTSGVAGDSLSFTASATDPSTVDTAAGFTYNWSFGDGTTATGPTASHIYSAAGTYTVSVTATDKDGGVSNPATETVSIKASTPYGGTSWTVPGQIQAENYDVGGQNVAYYDTTSGNSGKVYRADDVDITTSSNGGYCVQSSAPGEWLNYTVNVASSGTYVISFSVASTGLGGNFHVNFNGVNATGELQIPNTGFWQSWQTISTVVNLTAGQQYMQFHFDTWALCGYASGNLDWISLAKANTSLSPSITAPASGNEGSPIALYGYASGTHGTVTYWWDPTNSGSYTLVGSNVSYGVSR